MTRASRLAVLGLVLLALVIGAGLVGFAASTCPQELPGQPCPDAGRNQAVAVLLAALAVAALAAPFAFLGEFAVRRRIAYRGAWARAARRGLLAGGVVAALGGLRMGDALSPAGLLFVLLLAGVAEWFGIRWLDRA